MFNIEYIIINNTLIIILYKNKTKYVKCLDII